MILSAEVIANRVHNCQKVDTGKLGFDVHLCISVYVYVSSMPPFPVLAEFSSPPIFHHALVPSFIQLSDPVRRLGLGLT